MATALNLNNLRERGARFGAELETQARTLYDVLKNRSKAVVGQARTTVEKESAAAEARVREAITQVQHVVKETFGEPVGELIRQETTLLGQAEAALKEARGRSGGNAALTTVVDGLERALEAYRAIDERGHGVIDRVLGSSQLPIPDYDELNVKEANASLQGLDETELKVVQAYERRNKARKTVLREIDSLLSA